MKAQQEYESLTERIEAQKEKKMKRFIAALAAVIQESDEEPAKDTSSEEDDEDIVLISLFSLRIKTECELIREGSRDLVEQVKEDIEELKKKKYLFVAGGVGTAPVYPQVKWLKEHGIDVDVIMGSKTKDLLILEEEMKAVAGNLYVTTDDGSYGHKGMVTEVIKDLVNNQGKKYDVCVAIGPMIMMKFVCKLTKELGIPTVVSMNPIMVDGTGMCGGCRVSVGGEIKFACVDGPEFDGHLVNWDEAMMRQQTYKTAEGRAMLKELEGETHHGGCGHCEG